MLLGKAGIVSVIATLVIGLGDAPGRQLAIRLGVLVAGLVTLWVATSRPAFNQWVKRVIDAGLRRWTDLDVQDYVQLLDVEGEHAVHDVRVREGGMDGRHDPAGPGPARRGRAGARGAPIRG